MKIYLIFVIGLLNIVKYLHGFEIVNSSILPSPTPKIGSSVTLICRSDSGYEYCNWSFGELKDGKYCRFERKKSSPDSRKQKCAHHDRVQVEADYNAHECKILLSNIRLSDSGDWTCEMYESSYGSAKSIPKAKTLRLEVISTPYGRSGIKEIYDPYQWLSI